MKIAAAIGTSILGLVLGNPALVRAQHGHEDGQGSSKHGNDHEKDHGRSSAQQPSNEQQSHAREERHEAQNHEGHGEHGNSGERQKPHYQPAYAPGHAHEAHEHERHDAWEGHRAKHWEHEHHTWHERGGYRGYRIPPDRFRTHFGRGHWFRVHSAPVMIVGGYPRFQYGGFWFSVVDPWPEYWSRTWYDTDDVYVDYAGDGYYMYNRRHPGVAIAVNVSF
jgi:hypothetical protein